MFSKLRTKTKINILIFGVSIIIALLMLFFYLNIYGLLKEKDNAQWHDTISEVEESIRKKTDSAAKIGAAIASNELVREYFAARDSSRKTMYAYLIKEAAGAIADFADNVVYVSLIDSAGSELVLSGGDEAAGLGDVLLNKKPELSGVPKAIYVNEAAYLVYDEPLYSESSAAGGEKTRSVRIAVKADFIGNLVKKSDGAKENSLYIIDGGGLVVASNQAESEGKTLEIDSFQGRGAYLSGEISGSGLRIAAKALGKGYERELRVLVIFTFSLFFIIILLFLAINAVFRRNVVNPLESLTAAIVSLGDKNRKERIDISFDNEMGIIANSINSMLDRIEGMTKNIFNTQGKLYGMEISKNIAVISALQSQINPHFLYNTLECMRSIGKVNQIQEIVDISTAMAQIFRYSIKSGEFVTVRQELDIVNDYLKIMNTRYSGKFDIICDIEESLYDYKIIKMIIQPIVENAIYHGLEKKMGRGELKISGHIESGRIIITVADNGPGMTKAKLKEVSASIYKDSTLGENTQRGIGLSNVNTRIRMHMGEDFGISIKNIDEGGLMVRLELAVLGQMPPSGRSDKPQGPG